MPPIAGLQDMRPMLSRDMVRSSVAQPIRADASAASIPAWPPPMTTTSYLFAEFVGNRDSYSTVHWGLFILFIQGLYLLSSPKARYLLLGNPPHRRRASEVERLSINSPNQR